MVREVVIEPPEVKIGYLLSVADALAHNKKLEIGLDKLKKDKNAENLIDDKLLQYKTKIEANEKVELIF